MAAWLVPGGGEGGAGVGVAQSQPGVHDLAGGNLEMEILLVNSRDEETASVW